MTYPILNMNNEMVYERMAYTVTWKDEDTNRVRSKRFTGNGEDHSAFDNALDVAEAANGNLWPWVIERNGEEIASGWGGSHLNRGRLFPTCG